MIMNVNPLILSILEKRGITEPSEIEEFISEKPQLTYDPFLLTDMQEGVDFVLNAIKNNDKICIYGDYDVDGITASALLYNFFSNLTKNISYFIPSRFEEGYGLNNDALTQLKESGIDTIITVDCGAVSINEVQYAKSIGLNIMVTDHHNMEKDTTPDCIVINPKHPDSVYPFDGLCGCGVAFKLIQAITRQENIDKKLLNENLDLVAIATVADVVTVTDENRTLLKYGLKRLNSGSRKALRMMANKLDIQLGSIDSYKIGFIIGPHMNAAGRMEDANAVVKLLTSDDNKEIDEILDMLIVHNKNRKSVQEKCFNESISIIEENYMDKSFLVVKPKSIHEGIAGIVAGKIKEKYNKPAIVLSESTNEAGEVVLKGSGRSIENVNLIKMLLNYEELFVKVGGHAMAAGFTIPKKNEDKLRDSLENEMKDLIAENPNLLEKTFTSDAEASPSDIKLELAKEFNLLAPFGIDNPRPVIELKNLEVSNIKYLGNENQHVKFYAGGFECILFGNAQDYKEIIESGDKVELLGNPDINTWNGRESIQFMIKNIVRQEA